ncbi:MAG: VTC domain-containing protein, partial [Coriobacteriales bacterium]|nr:VTC domain-containing protein [Coriobacteriales bacterium]
MKRQQIGIGAEAVVGVDLEGDWQSGNQAVAAAVVPMVVASRPAMPASATATMPTASPNVFARQEKKYLLASGVGERLLARLGGALTMDGFGPTRITNLYLDTSNYLLIRRSIEKPDFKEKLRIRVYGEVASGSHPVFLEVKKKYLGTVYKRRIRMTLCEAKRFVEDGIMPSLVASLPRQSNSEKAVLNRQI